MISTILFLCGGCLKFMNAELNLMFLPKNKGESLSRDAKEPVLDNQWKNKEP